MKHRALLFLLLAVSGAVVVDISRYAREQSARGDGWREEYFALLDVLDHVREQAPDALEGSGWE